MKKVNTVNLIWCLNFLPIVAICQQNGIQFEKNLNFREILAKAKEAHKYIFVDCYATWCAPCRLMEKDVYVKDSVSDFMNKNFISVKFQMDSSRTDDKPTKQRYADAHAIGQKYKINAYPSFLFFSPEGSLVHKGIGYKDVPAFVGLGEDALNPKRQYFTLLKNYEIGHTDYLTMSYLAQTAISLGDDKIGLEIGRNCIDNYLMHLDDTALYTKENIEFISQFTRKSKDKSFDIFYLHSDRANAIMADSFFCQRIVNYIISVEEIDPKLVSAQHDSIASPDWGEIRSAISL